jgi:hypothetical protein
MSVPRGSANAEARLEFGKLIADETEKWTEIVKFAKYLGGVKFKTQKSAGLLQRPFLQGTLIIPFSRSSSASPTPDTA